MSCPLTALCGEKIIFPRRPSETQNQGRPIPDQPSLFHVLSGEPSVANRQRVVAEVGWRKKRRLSQSKYGQTRLPDVEIRHDRAE